MGSASVITVPAFASARDGIRHFLEPGIMRLADKSRWELLFGGSSGDAPATWLAVKQVHGT